MVMDCIDNNFVFSASAHQIRQSPTLRQLFHSHPMWANSLQDKKLGASPLCLREIESRSLDLLSRSVTRYANSRVRF